MPGLRDHRLLPRPRSAHLDPGTGLSLELGTGASASLTPSCVENRGPSRSGMSTPVLLRGACEGPSPSPDRPASAPSSPFPSARASRACRESLQRGHIGSAPREALWPPLSPASQSRKFDSWIAQSLTVSVGTFCSFPHSFLYSCAGLREAMASMSAFWLLRSAGLNGQL